MKRRQFLTNSVAAAAVASIPASAAAQSETAGAREYYELRRYHLQSGAGQKLTDQYVAEALIPALNRLGISPVGAFNLYLGPETPALYLLLPSPSLDKLATSELLLSKDDEYMKAGSAFLKAPAEKPPFLRVESSLMIAFEGFPKLVLPPATAQHASRVFQLRTYESPTSHDHRVKIDMFHHGEFDYFKEAGFWNVFFGDTLIGAHMPNLTYMISFPNLSELNAKWEAFNNVPGWKKLRSSPTYNFEPIVSNISNLILNPASYSQI